MLTYEEKLDRDSSWALEEGGRYFECRSAVHDTLRRITKILTDHGIDYAVVGAMAMFFHGYRRFTESIDLIVTTEGLAKILDLCEEHRFQLDSSGRSIRDENNGVKIVFLVSGLGRLIHGLPPVRVPFPQNVSVEIDGLRVVSIATLMEIKMTSGQASHRLKDLGDAQSVIQHFKLPLNFAEKLDPSLRDAYSQIWTDAQTAAQDDY